jgi:hypothetical protein
MRKIEIPFNTESLSVQDMKSIASTMRDLVNRIMELRLEHANNWDTDKAAQDIDEFFWKFKISTEHISTDTIEKYLKEMTRDAI